MSDLDNLPSGGTKPADTLLDAALAAWNARVLNDEAACEYLEDETWRGVLIGFLLGQGMSLAEAHWCALSKGPKAFIH